MAASISTITSINTISSSSSSPSATPTPACANLYEIPISEAGCAVSFAGAGHKDAMEACCKSADVVSYFNDCGLYCVAAGQTIKDLQDCLFDQKVAYQDVFCNANVNATATNTNPELPPTASASVVAGKGGDDSGNGTDSGSGSGSGDGNNDGGDGKSAATRLEGFSKTGMTIGALLVSALAFGAVQI
ncbi:hypothetical protein EV127DRAFT_439276 [Xylaria flabelliformis]|nr:hypothetical protein EV127DRAFT_439276 [Xylaria flabelliformis]